MIKTAPNYKISIKAKPIKPGQSRASTHLNPDKPLQIDVMQKLFYKLLSDCDHDFDSLIGSKVSVVNSRLILDRSDDTYLVREVHKKSGYFTYKQDNGKVATLSQARRNSNVSLSPSLRTKPSFQSPFSRMKPSVQDENRQ